MNLFVIGGLNFCPKLCFDQILGKNDRLGFVLQFLFRAQFHLTCQKTFRGLSDCRKKNLKFCPFDLFFCSGDSIKMSYGRRSVGKRIRMDESPPSSEDQSEANYRDQSEDSEFDPMAFYQKQQQEMLLEASQHIQQAAPEIQEAQRRAQEAEREEEGDPVRGRRGRHAAQAAKAALSMMSDIERYFQWHFLVCDNMALRCLGSRTYVSVAPSAVVGCLKFIDSLKSLCHCTSSDCDGQMDLVLELVDIPLESSLAWNYYE